MITSISDRYSGSHAWSPWGEYEHEVTLQDGSVADLKADYELTTLRIEATSLRIELLRIGAKGRVAIVLQGPSGVQISGTLPAGDESSGDLGFMGARLLAPMPPDRLAIGIDTDYLEIRCLCESVDVITEDR